MKNNIGKRYLSLLLTFVLCFALIAGTGVFSTNAADYEVYLRGTFNEWENPPEYLMTNDDNNHAQLTVHLDAGTHYYKVATQDWSTCVIPSGDNASLYLDSDADVTFVADFNSGTVDAFVASTLDSSDDISGVTIRSKWMEHSYAILSLKGEKVSYVSNSSKTDEDNYIWNLIPTDDGYFYLQNDSTRGYAYLYGNEVLCNENGSSGDAGKWTIDTSTGSKRFINKDNPQAVINIECLGGAAQATPTPIYYTSAQWDFEYGKYSYKMFPDGVKDTGYNIKANSAESITSYATGKAQTWTLSKDISGQPIFKAPNSPLAAAVYNLSMEETLDNIYTDDFGQVFRTGTEWNKVWTRDTAMACMYSLSWIFPEISYNCQREKIKTDGGISVFEEDTGTGGSYPVSTDKIITMLSVWETYLVDGNKDHLAYFYDVCQNTIMQDLNVCYDKDAGLFRGETSGTDWRDQTYPDWTSETYDDGLNNIAESKSASVNVYYVRALEIMSRAAQILGKTEEESKSWAKMAEDLEKKVSERLWNDNLGLYSAWEYPEYMGSVKAEKADVIGNGFALWFNVGTDEQLGKIAENYPLVPYGAPTVYPQKMGTLANAEKYYHNRGIWPGWQVALMIGANYAGNEAVAEEIFNSNIRGAASALTNKEVINYETGEGICSSQQLWSIAGTLSGYYRVLFGMNFTEDGISFDPSIPDWMEGPFTLENFKYKDANLTVNLHGKGDKLSGVTINGEGIDGLECGYTLPAGIKGDVTLDIYVEESGETDKVNLSDDNLVICPPIPKMFYQGGMLYWSPQNDTTLKLWTGKEYIDVTGTQSYKVDQSVYGCYSLMSVSKDGICSELSQPIVVSPTRIKVEAESGKVSSGSCIKTTTPGYSGTGYVQDRKTFSADLEITVDIPRDGRYLLSGIYNNPGDATSGTSCAIRSVYVDGMDQGSLCFPEVYSNHIYQLSTHLSLELTKGEHKVKIFYDKSNFYDRNMNITGNNVDLDYFNFDLVEAYGDAPQETTVPTTAPTTAEDTTIPTTAPTTAEDTTIPTTAPTTAEDTTEPTTATETSENPTDPLIVKGDADGDGDVDISDVTYIQKYLASFTGYSCTVAVCDVTGSGAVTIQDATTIQKFLIGMIKEL